MALFRFTELKNTTFIPTLGKSCGAGLATIGLAGAGIGVITYQPQIFKRMMHRASTESFIKARDNFFKASYSRPSQLKYVHLVAGKHTDWKSSFSQNTRYRVNQYLVNKPSDTAHYGILSIPNCECNMSSNEQEKNMFTAYDRIICFLQSNDCWMHKASFVVKGLGYATHNSKKSKDDLIDGKPAYMINSAESTKAQRTIFKRIGRFWANQAINRDLSDKPGGPQFFHIFEDHIELHFTKEMLCEFALLNSAFLNTHSDRLFAVIEDMRKNLGGH